ncbi:MAG TPA: ABC transporter permease, partial [Firmicutes bacterium]|nr:ABC transporter permease [Bacillota bacterium]
MHGWAVRRVLSLIVVLVLVSGIVYGLLEAAPGDFLDMMIASNPQLTQADMVRLRELYGMDRPVYVRYLGWLSGVLRGDMGHSQVYGLPVVELLKMRLGNTLLLTASGLTLAMLLAVPLGVWAALNRGSWIDHVAGMVAFAGLATPAFWFGIMLILLFGVKLGWLPAGGS